MGQPRNLRARVLFVVLLVVTAIVLFREHRPSFLRPGLRMHAYVSAADGSLTIADLVSLRAVKQVQVGTDIGDLREHAKLPEIWGTSPSGGFVWILDTRAEQLSARIPVGPFPYSIEFSSDGRHAYTTSAGANQLIAIDCYSRAIVAKAGTDSEPVQARVTPDSKRVVVVNFGAGTLGIYDAQTLSVRNKVNVIPRPDEVLIVPDGSLAFVMSRTESRLSVVDLKRGVLLANLVLSGKPTRMLAKPDGGELYVISPEAHGLQTVNTWTHELGDYMLLGSAPADAILDAASSEIYVADRAAGRIVPLDFINRRAGQPIPAGSMPGAMRFAPVEKDAKPSMLLVVDEGSGDLAVIRTRTDSLLTLIPIGNRPQRIAVKMF